MRNVVLMSLLGLSAFAPAAWADCSSPANAIVAENCLTGNDSSEWDISSNGAGDPSIQGFSTDISVNAGQTVFFKIKTPAAAYLINIYRMGYYGGMGARKVASITPSAPLPQPQPACLSDAATKLMDCGDWAVSASWAIPSSAVSGIYFAHLIRTDTQGDSHITFIVRNDASHSDVLYQTSDETWQAYNDFGGANFYGASNVFDLGTRAFKISYNRPFNTRAFEAASWVFYGEYPMVRWLESNGYDMTYFTGVDAARSGSLIANHKTYITAGHDEYASGPRRVNMEAARDAGVNMAFFSGNEFFWKTRWENSIDGSNVPYRTLVCYKETLAGVKSDPADPTTWTGTWRDARFSPPADGGRPENSLTGTSFAVNGFGADNNDLPILVPAADGQMRFWRNTSIATQAAGQTATLPAGTLGFEWDIDPDNGFRPAGLFSLSTSTYSMTTDLLLDYGGVYGAGQATHHLTMYRAPSHALVFGAGTVQWSWGLDSTHDTQYYAGSATDVRMQQATVNLLADMGTQPGTLQAGLFTATQTTDSTPPVSVVSTPAGGAAIVAGAVAVITGTATDYGGGVVGGVEVSTDGGVTWHPASGRASWSYLWAPTALGAVTIRSRATDDSGNLEAPSPGVAVTVAAPDCPCTALAASTPSKIDSGDSGSIETGVKFRTDYDGYINGVRFYKGAANTGTHVGNLWSSTGTLLATATFTGETASGWQQVNFLNPVAVTANTTYVASYFSPGGHYSADSGFFVASGLDRPPVHFLQDATSGGNGVFRYSLTSAFPTLSFGATNYWVDVVFIPSGTMPGSQPSLLTIPSVLSFAGYQGQPAPAGQSVTVFNQGTGPLTWSASASAPWIVLSPSSGNTPATLTVSVSTAGLANGNYTGTVTVTGSSGPPQTINVGLTVASLYLASNFASGSADGFANSPLGLGANWSIVNQALQYNGGGQTQLYAGDFAWADYDVQADIKLSTLSDFPGGIRGHVDPAAGGSYTVWLYPAEGLVRLYRTTAWNINSGFVQLGQAAAVFDTQNFHTVKLSFRGSQIQVFYDGKLLITATDATYAAGAIALDVSNQVVTFNNVLVTAPNTPPTAALVASANSLSFNGVLPGANPAAQTVQLSSSGAGALAWTAVSTVSWLSVTPTNGTGAATLQVSANMSALTPGSYSGAIRLTAYGAANSPLLLNVGFTVAAAPPVIVMAPASLNFTATLGQAAPAAQAVTIADGGYGSFNWTLSSDAAWLTATPSSGSTPASAGVSVSASGLAVGTYTGHVIVSAAGVANSPLSIPVTMSVLAQNLAENFSDLASGWTISPMGNAAGWSVAGGVYTYNGAGLSQSCTGNSGWTNYTFDTNVRLSSLSNWPGGVRGRVNPATGAGYAVWLYPGSGLAILYGVPQWSIGGPGLVALAQAHLSFDNTNFHDLQLSFQGSQISVSWDGNPLMSVTDSTYTGGYVCMDADSQPISYSNVRVAAPQNPVTVTAAPAALIFSSVPGTSAVAQTVAVAAGGAQTSFGVTSSAAWLTAVASSSLTPGSLTVSVNAAGLAEGTYTGSVTISAPGATNSPLTIPVTLAVKTAALAVTPSKLTFFGATTANPANQNASISNVGSGVLNWSASADSSWIGLGSATGTAPATLSISANSSALAAGSYNGNVTIGSADVSNGPATIPVSLQVGSLNFSDNFATGAGNWTISPLGNAAGWSAANNVYSYNGGGHTQSFAGNSTWANYTVAANFQLASTSDYPGGLRGRLNTSTGASYAVWIYPNEHILKLYRIGQWNIDAGFSLLAQSAPVTTDTKVHSLRLVFQGTQIQVYYDDALAIQATDATYSQGAIALDVSNQPIGFSNVSVIGF